MKKNDISGTLNSFHVLNSVPNSQLLEIARNSNVVLGESEEVINRQINIIKAKELAEAVLVAARAKKRQDEEEAKDKNKKYVSLAQKPSAGHADLRGCSELGKEGQIDQDASGGSRELPGGVEVGFGEEAKRLFSVIMTGL